MSLTIFPNKIEIFHIAGIGKVSKTISAQHIGQVRFQATYWRARLHQTKSCTQILPGHEIRVIGREGLTLLVMPLAK
ncbi:hypothetical protein D0962_16415 [Leptolyngbyaceae cyanobacterium CCMR0082]|uniref:NfeD family protein n=2 Tax=Cyanobacteriota TaxID=1117 RepID=A0A947GK53_9CYAN|nr:MULTISPECIES: NfeD family protein [Cyanobacteriota]MBT9316453.1 NfeD family protein [Leptothoe spongobia TAU-MAC 1115]NEZ64355.1 hypothetical protein [Adonisia turfae CCMR0082]